MKMDGVELWHKATLSPLKLLRYRLWLPGHLAALRRHPGLDAAGRPGTDETHLRAAAQWLAAAQDASADGGIVGRYTLATGWTTSYPETTGYIIPTFLALGRHLDAQYYDRARRCVEFLHTTQLASGAFPSGEIGASSTRPSPFNSAQIINGLLAFHQYDGDLACFDAAIRAGNWLVSVQDGDGAWRQGFYHDAPACYAAHLSCWLAELGAFANEQRFLEAARRNLDWIVARHDSSCGWIDGTGFTESEQSLRVADLHTVGYTLAGMLQIAQILKRDDALNIVEQAARAVGATLDRLAWLPGVLDHLWRAKADSGCLTGNAQMALVWMDLYGLTQDQQFLTWAYRALELVQATQLMDSSNAGLRGGVPGTTPTWGWYNDGAVLSWSAKFLIDALLRKSAIEAQR